MGALHTIKNLIAPRSSSDERADLAKAEAAHLAAVEAGDRKAADDAAWAASQLRLAIGRAEAREAEVRAEADARARAVRRAEIAARVANVERTPALVDAWVAEAAGIGARLAQLQKAMLDHEDQVRRDVRFIADECRAIGDAQPAYSIDAPLFASGWTRLCQIAVRERNVADGISFDVEQRACELVRGTHRP